MSDLNDGMTSVFVSIISSTNYCLTIIIFIYNFFLIIKVFFLTLNYWEYAIAHTILFVRIKVKVMYIILYSV